MQGSNFLEENILSAKKFINSAKTKDFSKVEIGTYSIELASLLINIANEMLSPYEKKALLQKQKSLDNLNSRAFSYESIDLGFRSKNNNVISHQIGKLIKYFGIPKSFSTANQIKLFLFKILHRKFYNLITPYIQKTILDNFSHLLIDEGSLSSFINESKNKLIIAPLNEKSISHSNSEKNLSYYLELIENQNIENLSIKVSSLIPNLNINAYENSLSSINQKLFSIFDVARKREKPIYIHLDMENYLYFAITVDAFITTLKSSSNFDRLSCGITLQAYLPDSFNALKKLIDYSQQRAENNLSPITISIVKGSYRQYEQVIASLKRWAQSSYISKIKTDANFKKMIDYSFSKIANIKNNEKIPFFINICTHNIFDISYALLLQANKNIENSRIISFQMLRGRTPHIRRALELILDKKIKLYAGIYSTENVNEIVPFLHRRLDEKSSFEGFIKYALSLQPGGENWDKPESIFLFSLKCKKKLSSENRRISQKKTIPIVHGFYGAFDNEPTTDFSLPSSRKWQDEIFNKCLDFETETISSIIDGKKIISHDIHEKISSYQPAKPLYKYHLANEKDLEKAASTANEYQNTWLNVSLEKKMEIISKAAQLFRNNRSILIQSLIMDNSKLIKDADTEISESIDMMEYYLARANKLFKFKDIEFTPKGTIYIATGRSFASSLPISAIAAALLTGNTVIFKPPLDSLLTAWHLTNLLWEAGIPKNALHLIITKDAIAEKVFLENANKTSNYKISFLILSGKALTVEKFVNINPLIDLTTLSEGKNIMIITNAADRKLAIKNLVTSAFAFSGQQYSCPSIAIIDKELYDDKSFLLDIKNMTKELSVGSPLSSETDISPMLYPPQKELITLEGNEKWLLKPSQDKNDNLLWSPGIKLNLTEKSSLFNIFMPGPVLGLIRAENFDHALSIAKKSKYGLTAGLQSLDSEEHIKWKNSVNAGNLYINGIMTESKIKRQPFGGIKKSSYGIGYKTGGPNFLLACTNAKQISLPKEKKAVNSNVNSLTSFIEKIDLTAEELGIWYGSIANYAFWWQKMKSYRDPTKIIGQDNFFGYVPFKSITLRILPESNPLDIIRIIAAALTVKVKIEISFSKKENVLGLDWSDLSHLVPVIEESMDTFINRLEKKNIKRIKTASKTPDILKIAASKKLIYVDETPALANGRKELLKYVREISICNNYHRYGSLGVRDTELRKPSV